MHCLLTTAGNLDSKIFQLAACQCIHVSSKAYTGVAVLLSVANFFRTTDDAMFRIDHHTQLPAMLGVVMEESLLSLYQSS